jgi:WS/DGAT/MGAT family acyltransferase
MPRERLSPLDQSFLRVETPSAHMHVAGRLRFAPAPGAKPITLGRVRDLVHSRLHAGPRFRQRLAFPPAGLGAPLWVDDPGFDLDWHVTALAPDGDVISRGAFAQLTDAVLSEPLDRGRPLWRIHLVPRLEDGTTGLILKAHHAMVDGLSALALGLLLLDLEPEPADGPVAEPPAWTPDPPPGGARLAVDALAGTGVESLRVARNAVRMVGSRTLGDTLRRTALAVGEDVLRPAPASYVNVPIGPRRTLRGHRIPIADLLDVRAARGTTLNDVALAIVSGALRQLALSRGTMPAPLKAMVPVSRRGADEGNAPGNRIAFVSVTLPLHVRAPLRRLDEIAAQTRAFKASDRAAGNEALLGALAVLPGPLQDAAARFASSARAYNLVVSNVPGPRVPVHLLGAACVEALPVIPLSEGHALSIGILSLHDALCFSVYADPEALPDAAGLPGAISAAALETMRAAGRRAPRRVA